MYEKFKQLERELLNAQMDLRLAEANKKRLIELGGPKKIKALQYDKIGGKNVIYQNPIEYYEQLAIVVKRIRILKDFIACIERIKSSFIKDVEEFNEKFNDLEMKVFYLHHIKRKPLVNIANDLKYDYGYIRKINMNIVKFVKEGTKKEHLDFIDVL